MFYYANSNIKYLRKRYNFTQPEFAKKLNIAKSTLANIESNVRRPSLDILDKIHCIFKISMDDLIYKDLSKI